MKKKEQDKLGKTLWKIANNLCGVANLNREPIIV